MADYTIDWNAVEREAVGLLSRYLQIDTTNPSGNETRGAVFLQEILAREGIESDIYESLPGRGSLVTRYGGSHEMPDIILLHHIDVVPAEADKWLHPPFSGLVRDGEIWGRGALDCKSLGIMELMAFVLLKRQGLNPERALVYAATADEEAAGTWGVPWLMKHRPGLLATRYVINEGVGFGFRSDRHNLHLCQVAEKAACWVRIRFEGRPGHGSLPHEDNCVIDMARAIEALSLHRFPVRVSPPVEKFIAGIAAIQEFMPETEFLRILDPECSRGVLEKIPDEVLRRMIGVALCNTAVPTVASAGSKTNVIPGECFCEVDCRTLPGSTAQELKNTLAEILASRGCRNFSIELEGDPRPTESSCDTPLYQAIEKAFLRNDPQARVVPYMSPGATDSRFFREIGVPAYGVQFDSSVESAGLIHGHNERIRIEHVTMGVRVLYDTIKEFCVS